MKTRTKWILLWLLVLLEALVAWQVSAQTTMKADSFAGAFNGNGGGLTNVTATNVLNYFVVNSAAANASDSNPGTVALPMLSITNAFAKRNGNSIHIFVAGGSYTNQVVATTNDGTVVIEGNSQSPPGFYFGTNVLAASFSQFFTNITTHYVCWSNALITSSWISLSNAITEQSSNGKGFIWQMGTPVGGFSAQNVPYPLTRGTTNRMPDTPLLYTNNLTGLTNGTVASAGGFWTLTNDFLYVIYSDGGVARSTWLPSGNSSDTFLSASINSQVILSGVNIYFANYGVNTFDCPSVVIKNCYLHGCVFGINILSGGGGHSDIEQNEIDGTWADALDVTSPSIPNQLIPAQSYDNGNWIHDTCWHSIVTDNGIVAQHVNDVCSYSISEDYTYVQTGNGGQSFYVNCVGYENLLGTDFGMDGGSAVSPNIISYKNCESIGAYSGISTVGNGYCSGYISGGYYTNAGTGLSLDTTANGQYWSEGVPPVVPNQYSGDVSIPYAVPATLIAQNVITNNTPSVTFGSISGNGSGLTGITSNSITSINPSQIYPAISGSGSGNYPTNTPLFISPLFYFGTNSTASFVLNSLFGGAIMVATTNSAPTISMTNATVGLSNLVAVGTISGNGAGITNVQFAPPLTNYTDASSINWVSNLVSGMAIGLNTNLSPLYTFYKLPATNVFVNMQYPHQIYLTTGNMFLLGLTNGPTLPVGQHTTIDLYNLGSPITTNYFFNMNPQGNVTQSPAYLAGGTMMRIFIDVEPTNSAYVTNMWNVGAIPGAITGNGSGITNCSQVIFTNIPAFNTKYTNVTSLTMDWHVNPEIYVPASTLGFAEVDAEVQYPGGSYTIVGAMRVGTAASGLIGTNIEQLSFSVPPTWGYELFTNYSGSGYTITTDGAATNELIFRP